jgi:hypothetical protein
LGSCHADVTEAAFFFDVVGIEGKAAVMRQDALFQANHIHVREFQALGRVQRHQDNGIFGELLFFFVAQILLAESHFVDEAAQRRLLGAFFVGSQGVDDFLDGGPAGLLLVGVGIEPFQLALVADLDDESADEIDEGL